MILHSSDKVNVKTIQTAQDCITAAGNPEMLSAMEELVVAWCKQIEQVKPFVYTGEELA